MLSPEGEISEVVHLLDLATTNKTSFFREAEHFQYLTQHALPRLVQDPSVRARGRLRMWSAACSLGMEVYTLAMVVAEFLQKNGLGGWDFDILGTDISTKVLKAAKLGIYPEQDAASVPAEMRRKYFARGKGERAGTVRVLPGLRSRVRFARVNLMAPLPASEAPMQVIMCRNALIYFERDGQTAIVDNLRRHLEMRVTWFSVCPRRYMATDCRSKPSTGPSINTVPKERGADNGREDQGTRGG